MVDESVVLDNVSCFLMLHVSVNLVISSWKVYYSTFTTLRICTVPNNMFWKQRISY